MNDRLLRVDLTAAEAQRPGVFRQAANIPGVEVRPPSIFVFPDAVRPLQRLLQRPLSPLPRAPLLPSSGQSFPGAERLRTYQSHGAQRLARRGKVGLIYPCGTGKTPTVLAALRLAGARKALVVTSTTGRRSYLRDAQWVSGLRVAEVTGRAYRPDQPPSLRGTNVPAAYEASDILVVGYEVLEQRLPDLGALRFDVLVADELHRAKSSEARRFDALDALRGAVEVAWGVTATPVRDRRRDLLAQLQLLTPDRFSDGRPLATSDARWAFLKRYCGARPGPFGYLTHGPSKDCPVPEHITQELKERLRYYFDVRTKRELAPELPAKTRVITRIENCARFDSAGNLEDRLANACAAKLETAVDAVIDALNEGAKVVVTTGRNEQVGRIGQALATQSRRLGGLANRLRLQTITGESSVSRRMKAVDGYMRAPGPACFVTGYDWFGESIDVQDTDHLFVLMLPWTPGRVDQLEGRVHRIGLSRPVAITYFVAQGTVDDEIERLLLSKLESVEGAGIAVDGTPWQRAAVPTEAEMLERLRRAVP